MPDDKTKDISPEVDYIEGFPPSHNPVIGLLKKDTLGNIRNGMAALEELARTEDFSTAPELTNGYHILNACLFSALEFEMYHRK